MEEGSISLEAAGLVIAAGVIWGTVSVIVKILVRSIDPALIAFSRMLLGGTVITIILLTKRGFKIPAPNWKLVGLAAVGMALNYLLYTIGLQYTLASVAAMVVQSEVIFLVILSVILLGESFGPKKAMGMCMALTGVAIITWNGQNLRGVLGSQYLMGNVIVFVAGFFWAVYAYCQKKLTSGSDVLVSLSPIFLISSIMLLPMSLGSLGTVLRFSLNQILALLYLGIVCTGISYILLAEGIKRIPASTTGVLTTVMPVTSVIIAFFVLQEVLTIYIILGAILDLGGLILVIRSKG